MQNVTVTSKWFIQKICLPKLLNVINSAKIQFSIECESWFDARIITFFFSKVYIYMYNENCLFNSKCIHILSIFSSTSQNYISIEIKVLFLSAAPTKNYYSMQKANFSVSCNGFAVVVIRLNRDFVWTYSN